MIYHAFVVWLFVLIFYKSKILTVINRQKTTKAKKPIFDIQILKPVYHEKPRTSTMQIVLV